MTPWETAGSLTKTSTFMHQSLKRPKIMRDGSKATFTIMSFKKGWRKLYLLNPTSFSRMRISLNIVVVVTLSTKPNPNNQ